MQRPDNAILLYPNSLEEAIAVWNSHPEAKIISTVSYLLGQTALSANDKVIIDLSKADDLNFFMEDHGFWFIGASLPLEELTRVIRERIPGFPVTSSGQNSLPIEISHEWHRRRHCRVHIGKSTGIDIVTLPVDLDHWNEATALRSGVPCMISIPKI